MASAGVKAVSNSGRFNLLQSFLVVMKLTFTHQEVYRTSVVLKAPSGWTSGANLKVKKHNCLFPVPLAVELFAVFFQKDSDSFQDSLTKVHHPTEDKISPCSSKHLEDASTGVTKTQAAIETSSVMPHTGVEIHKIFAYELLLCVCPGWAAVSLENLSLSVSFSLSLFFWHALARLQVIGGLYFVKMLQFWFKLDFCDSGGQQVVYVKIN